MNNKFKKLAAIMLVISGLSTVLVGCGGGDAGMGGKVNSQIPSSLK